MQDNKKYLKELTQGKRLHFLIKKYFNSQTEFGEIVGISHQLINKYCNNKTAQIPINKLKKIEKAVGFNSSFIQTGEGNYLIEGCKLKPIFENIVLIQNEPTIEKANEIKEVKVKEIELNRGKTDLMTLGGSGRNMRLSNTAKLNIIDTVFDNLKNPIVMHIIDSIFCNKYKMKIGTYIIIDRDNYKNGNIVLIKDDVEYYIAEYYKNKLTDIANYTDIPFEEKIEIVGAVYSKIEYF